jgi:Phage portal protein.
VGLFDLIKNYQNNKKLSLYAKTMNGLVPVFSSFGNDVYVSDIVNGAIRCIATEMSKLNPRHIRIDPVTGLQTQVNDEINRLFKFGPNPYMSTSDFLHKITYFREKKDNVYIYPLYEKQILGEGKYKRIYKGLYPLNPSLTEYMEDEKGNLWVKFSFLNGYDYTMPYADIIHWRKDYTENDFSGGNANGEPDTRAELKLLQTDDIITQGIDKGIKASLGVSGLLKMGLMMNEEEQKKERDKFEQKLISNQAGILITDLKSEFIPLKIDPQIIDKDTVEFIIVRVLAGRGVSLPIYNGTFTEEEYQAFFEKTLEYMIISLGRAFTRTLFTDRELDVGNEIICYNQGLMFTNMANKIKSVDMLTKIGVLTDNQVLGIFGYPPFEGGDIRHMSLNYINRDIADQYQLSKGKGKENQIEK